MPSHSRRGSKDLPTVFHLGLSTASFRPLSLFSGASPFSLCMTSYAYAGTMYEMSLNLQSGLCSTTDSADDTAAECEPVFQLAHK